MSRTLFDCIAKSDTSPLFNEKRHFVVSDGIGDALLIAHNYLAKKGRFVIVCANLLVAQKLFNNLSAFIDDNCYLFPSDEMLRIDSIAMSRGMIAERVFAMNELLTKDHYILITHTLSFTRFLPSPNLFRENTIHIEKGKELDYQEISKTLVNIGYSRVNKVDQSMQFAIRGDILDVYSINYDNPIRIELFGDEIESIKFFDVGTQTSKTKLTEIDILPASDFLFTELEENDIENKLLARALKDIEVIGKEKGELLMQKIKIDIDRFQGKDNNPNLYKYYGFLQNDHYSILDYATGAKIVLINEAQIEVSSTTNINETANYFLELFERGNSLSHLDLSSPVSRVIAKAKNVIKLDPLYSGVESQSFKVFPVSNVANTKTASLETINYYLNRNDKVIVALATKQQLEIITLLLKDNDIQFDFLEKDELPKSNLGVVVLSIEEGFELPDYKIAYLSSKELFNYHQFSMRHSARFKEGKILKTYEELEPGDYVVHEQYGIGKFIDIKTLEINGMHRDFIHIQYAGDDVLYVPLFQFKLVRKYLGKEGYVPKLNSLHSGDWEKTKNRIKERVSDVAERLLALYAARSKIEGYAFEKDNEFQNEFEARFPYELTDDQKKSLIEIKKDMESPHPMDRLLCGDVGFGKTEVAFCAAFKAILCGKQVAILCPTTLLARQHYERALERFNGFGVNIALLSRLVSEKEQKESLKKIKEGRIHLIIGTHRLLSKEIKYCDLGLLIVDEEQRFGVEQKEKIKELKASVDVLTLSATPIPRTLQMSLVNIRPLSQINTPPVNRYSVQTYVIPYDARTIKEIIERELARHGQVFYLHNKVETIYGVAYKLQEMIKEARIGVVHGQMAREEIESVMFKFYNGEIDVLVCTSIIENGIDIENVNTIVIENADNFGLSQLYQIKGRVGRGDRIAYAYLLYRANKKMNETAIKRLKAIQDFTELGSGYKIAQRDLLIRGAGDILGSEQAGFIDSIGIDMYIKLLNEVIKEKKDGTTSPKEDVSKVNDVDAYIPKEYAVKSDKLDLYHDIESAMSMKELENVKKTIRDIYGKIPREVESLFIKRRVDLLANSKAIQDVFEYSSYLDIILSTAFTSIESVGYKIFESLIELKDAVQVTYIKRVMKVRVFKDKSWLETLEFVLKAINEIFQERDETSHGDGAKIKNATNDR